MAGYFFFPWGSTSNTYLIRMSLTILTSQIILTPQLGILNGYRIDFPSFSINFPTRKVDKETPSPTKPAVA